MNDTTEGDWVPGLKCTKCHGTGESEDARTCIACAGTGDVWMTWKQRAEAAEARVAELEALIDRVSVASGWLPVENREQATDTICKRIARTDTVVAELEAQNARLREAIQNCVDWSNGRESEWGERAENAFAFLHKALADGKAAPS